MRGTDELITVAEACEILKLGKTKVYEMLKDGTLERVRFGRAVRTSRRSCDELIRVQSEL